MGWCRDFGSQIAAGCDHPMRAGSGSCQCELCGVICTGRFGACPTVWAQGPQPVVITLTSANPLLDGPRFDSQVTNGHQTVERVVSSPPLPAAPSSAVAAASPAAPAAAAAAAAVGGVQPPPPTSAAAGDIGAEVLHSFQDAFDALRREVEGFRSSPDAVDALRLEVEGLRSALSQEQALLAALVESRADRGLDGEALRQVVTDAVQTAVRREAADLETALAATVDTLRGDLGALRQAHLDTLAGLRESMEAASAALPAEMSRRDSGNRKALRTTLHEEFLPLVEVVAESIAQSEYQLQCLDRRLDRFEELGTSLSAGFTKVTASLEFLVGEELQPVPDDEPTPARAGLRRQAVGGQAASGVVARGAVRPSVTALPRSPRDDKSALGRGEPVTRARRVSMRNPPEERYV